MLFLFADALKRSCGVWTESLEAMLFEIRFFSLIGDLVSGERINSTHLLPHDLIFDVSYAEFQRMKTSSVLAS